MVDWQLVVVPLFVIALSVLIAVVVTSVAVRRGWAYREDRSGTSGWWGWTSGDAGSDHNGVSAVAVFMGTLFLTLGIALLVGGTLLGR